MYVLGINGDFGRASHNPFVFLYRNGRLLFGCEEERINRIRFSDGRIPELAIRKCLRYCKIKIEEINYIAFPQETWGEFFDKRLHDFFICKFNHCPEFRFYNHHLSHAASTYYNSGFGEALIVTADCSGDGISTAVFAVKDGTWKQLKTFTFPNSFGYYYSSITQFIGYNKNSDEYKVMGLSAYGNNVLDFSEIIKYKDNEYEISTKIINDNAYELRKFPLFITKQDKCYSDWLEEVLKCKPRIPGAQMSQTHMNIAASAQSVLEDVIKNLIHYYIKETSIHDVCLAGGTFMNCLLNGKIYEMEEVKRMYVPPVCDDAGTAMGAAVLCMEENGYNVKPIKGAYWGEGYTDDEVISELKRCGIKFENCREKICSHAAEELEKGNIIGWFQGRMEIGARALGNRSILANPQYTDMKDKVNIIKKREKYQPFAPSVIDSEKTKYFYIDKECSDMYMTITFTARDKYIDKIPAVVHLDKTSRVQAVAEELNPRYYNLLKEFNNKTNCPVVLNTSLNRKGEPIARTINDAVAILYSTNLSGMAIGTCFISKEANVT